MNPPFLGFAALARKVFEGTDLKPLTARLLERAQANLDEANALMDLSVIFQFGGGQDELALALQEQALAVQRTYHLPAARQPARIRLLALMTPGLLVDNLPLDPLQADSDVELIQHYVVAEGITDPASLPEHDLLFVAVGESDRTQTLLARLEGQLRDWPKPVLNPPARIAQMARDRCARLLAGIPGTLVPASNRVSRHWLEVLANGVLSLDSLWPEGRFPLLARPLGTHAGKGLEKLESLADARRYLDAHPAEKAFTLSPFADYAGPDGLYRKYRVVMIAGQPFASHMAISSHWMVHYLNADMTDNAGKRAEEAAFMQTFDSGFALRHRAALAAIQQRLQLDYYAIDCAETADGQLLVFEADTAMIVHAFDPESIFPYKKPQMEKVFAAFRTALLAACTACAGHSDGNA